MSVSAAMQCDEGSRGMSGMRVGVMGTALAARQAVDALTRADYMAAVANHADAWFPARMGICVVGAAAQEQPAMGASSSIARPRQGRAGGRFEDFPCFRICTAST